MNNKPVEEIDPLFIQHAQITSTQVKKIELETQDQICNISWKQLRHGRITASKFHQVYTKIETICREQSTTRKSSTALSH